MPSFGVISTQHLNTATQRLQDLFHRVVEWYDCSILCGYRPEDQQQAAYLAGRSQVEWPHSKHNRSPSTAVDAGPWFPDRKVPWPQRPSWLKRLDARDAAELNRYIKDLAQWYHFAGAVEGTAQSMGIRIRWGGDWDRDHVFSNNKFDDLAHFEEYSET